MSAVTAAANALTPSGVSGEKAKAAVYIMIAAVIIIIVIILFKKGMGVFDSITGGVSSVFEFLGLKKSEEDIALENAAKQAEEQANLTDSPFNPKFYKTAPTGTPLITSATASRLAGQIWDSVGVLYDDPEAGFAAIKQCRNWAQVSFLADMFNNKYGRDLYQWLAIKYDTSHQKKILTQIVAYARALPKY